MKTIYKIVIVVFIVSFFSNVSIAIPKNNFQYLNVNNKKLNIHSIPSSFHKALKFDFLDDSNSCLRLLDGALFFAGLVLYCSYSNTNSSYHDYSYRNSSFALMGIGLCGGFATYLLESNHHSYYGPRSSLKNNKNVQLTLNSNGLGMKMNF